MWWEECTGGVQYSQYLEIKIVYVNKFYYILYFFDFVYSPNKHFDKMLGQPHELNTKNTMAHHLIWQVSRYPVKQRQELETLETLK